MDLPRFETEHFFAEFEFRSEHLLSASDCETVDVAELLRLAGRSLEELGRCKLGYGESEGEPALRHALAARHDGVRADDVLVLGAPVEGIDLAMRTLLGPDDRVAVVTPCYDALRNAAAHVAGELIEIPLRPTPESWELRREDWHAALDRKPTLVVVNFPHNPTGYSPDESLLRRLVEDCERAGAWLFCDEMYRGLEFREGRPLPSAAELGTRTIVLSGLSKAHGLPGLRIGWCIVRDRALFQRLLNTKFYTSICPPGPTQWLALAALEAEPTLLDRSCRQVRENVERADAFFADRREAYEWRPPRAGSVALVRRRDGDATDWCFELARTDGVVLLPGSCLGAPRDTFRLGLGRRHFAPGLTAFAAATER